MAFGYCWSLSAYISAISQSILNFSSAHPRRAKCRLALMTASQSLLASCISMTARRRPVVRVELERLLEHVERLLLFRLAQLDDAQAVEDIDDFTVDCASR